MECGSGMGSTKGSPMTNVNPQQPPSAAAAAAAVAAAAAAAGGPGGINCSSPMGSPMPGCSLSEMGSVLNRSPAAGGIGSPLCSGPSPHLNNSNVNVGSGTSNSSTGCPSSVECPGQKVVTSQQSNNVSVSTATVSCGMGVSGVGVVTSNASCGNVTMNGPGNNRLVQSQTSVQQQTQPSPQQHQHPPHQQTPQPPQQQQQINHQQQHPPQQHTPQSQQQQIMNHHPPHPPGMMGPTGMHPGHPMGLHHSYPGPKPMPVSAGKV